MKNTAWKEEGSVTNELSAKVGSQNGYALCLCDWARLRVCDDANRVVVLTAAATNPLRPLLPT